MQLTIFSNLSNYPKILEFFQSQALKICDEMKLSKSDLRLPDDDCSQLLKFLIFSSSIYAKISSELEKIVTLPDTKWKFCYSDISFKESKDSNGYFDFQFNLNLEDLIPNLNNYYPGFHRRKTISFLIREWKPLAAKYKNKRIVSLYKAAYATDIIDKFELTNPNIEQNLVDAVIQTILK
jgi:hypothetical protein